MKKCYLFILFGLCLLVSNQALADAQKLHKPQGFRKPSAEKRIKYTLWALPVATAKINAESSEEEQIRDVATYNEFRHKDPRLPSWAVVMRLYRKKHGNTKGLSAFMFPKRAGRFYDLKEVPSVIEGINAESSEGEQMNNIASYSKFRYKDPRLPSWTILINLYTKEHGSAKGLSAFIFPVRATWFYALEKIPSVIKRINARLSEAEQMRDVATYNEFRYTDPRLPSWVALAKLYKKEHGSSKGLSAFMFPKRDVQFYDLKEVPSVIKKINAKSPEGEQMNSIASYSKFRYKDPRLPSWTTLVNLYTKEHGNTQQGLSAFMFPERDDWFYDLEEIPSVIERINAESSEGEKMNSDTSYSRFRYKDPRLPSWDSVMRLYQEEHGSTQGLLAFMFPERENRFYALEEIPSVIERVNAESPEGEKMNSGTSYSRFRYKDLRLPPWTTLVKLYKKEHGSAKGLSAFMFPEKDVQFYDLKEVPSVIERINAKLSEGEQMNSIASYSKFRYKDPRLPSWMTLVNLYKKEHGNTQQGLSAFMFPNGTNQSVSKRENNFYALEEIPSVIERINAESSKREQMRNSASYSEFRYKDPKLPSWMTLANLYKKEHGSAQGLSAFIFPVRDVQFYDLEEVPSVIERINAESSEGEKMNSDTSYSRFRYKDPRLPSWDSVMRLYQEKHESTQGLLDFMFPERENRLYALEEIPSVIERMNAKSSERKQIKSVSTYRAFRFGDPKLPSWSVLTDIYRKKHGSAQGLSAFVFPKRVNQGFPVRVARFYTLEEIPSAIEKMNTESSEEEQMRSVTSYREFRRKDSRLPLWDSVVRLYQEKHGSTQGLLAFMFPETVNQGFPARDGQFYDLEKVPSVIERMNAELPEEEQMRNISTYKKFHHKDPGLPPWSVLTGIYRQKHGNTKGLSAFVFPARDAHFYALEEIPLVLARINAGLPEEEQIRDIVTYEKFHHKYPGLPSWSALANMYQKEHGNTKGFSVFVFSSKCQRAMVTS